MNQLRTVKSYEEIIKKQSMEHLMQHAEDDWGDPEENLDKVVRTGIETLDNIFIGFGPELIGLIGQSGSRKSTFIANVVLFNADKDTPQVILAAESGMTPERYRDVLLAMRATQYLKHWKTKGNLPVGTPDYLFADFFMYHKPNDTQKKAINLAMKDLASKPIYILGAGEKGGVDTLKEYEQIFAAMHDNLGFAAYYVDHIQSIYVPGVHGDYEIMQTVNPVLDRMVKLYESPIVVISQVSATSVRYENIEARGGAKLRELSSIYLKIEYERMPRHRVKLKIEKSRKSQDLIEVGVGIEPHSGLMERKGELLTKEENGSNANGKIAKDDLFSQQEVYIDFGD